MCEDIDWVFMLMVVIPFSLVMITLVVGLMVTTYQLLTSKDE